MKFPLIALLFMPEARAYLNPHLIFICLSLFTLSIAGLNIWIKKKNKIVPFSRIIALNVIPVIFLTPLFWQLQHSNDAFKKVEIAGKIKAITFTPRSTLFIGKDSTEVNLDFVADGLAVDDSFYKPAGSKYDFYYFKRDSLSQYRRIEFYSIHGSYKWQYLNE